MRVAVVDGGVCVAEKGLVTAVVERDEQGQRVVRQPYERGARDYCIGFACACFMAAVVVGSVLLFAPVVPMERLLTAFFLFYALIGAMVIAVGYTVPVKFYELLEEEPDA